MRWARGRAARSHPLLGASGSVTAAHLLSAKELAGIYGVSSSIFSGDLKTTEHLLPFYFFYFFFTIQGKTARGVHAACKTCGVLQNPESVLGGELFPWDGTRMVAASQTWGCFHPFGYSHAGLGKRGWGAAASQAGVQHGVKAPSTPTAGLQGRRDVTFPKLPQT